MDDDCLRCFAFWRCAGSFVFQRDLPTSTTKCCDLDRVLDSQAVPGHFASPGPPRIAQFLLPHLGWMTPQV